MWARAQVHTGTGTSTSLPYAKQSTHRQTDRQTSHLQLTQVYRIGLDKRRGRLKGRERREEEGQEREKEKEIERERKRGEWGFKWTECKVWQVPRRQTKERISIWHTTAKEGRGGGRIRHGFDFGSGMQAWWARLGRQTRTYLLCASLASLVFLFCPGIYCPWQWQC